MSFQQRVPISQTVPPVTVKPMMAGAVTVLWQTYYLYDFSLATPPPGLQFLPIVRR